MNLHGRIYRLLLTGLPVSVRIYLAAVVTILSTGACLFYSVYLQNKSNNKLHELLDNRVIAMHAAESVNQALLAHDDMLFRFLTTRSAKRLREISRLRAKTRQEIGKLKGLSNSRIVQSRLRLLETESDKYFADTQSILDFSEKNVLPQDAGFFKAAAWAREQDTHRKELSLLTADGYVQMNQVFSLCDELVTLYRSDLEEALQKIDIETANWKKTAMTVGAAAGGVIFIVAFWLALSLLGPLDVLKEGVERVEKGDLTHEIPVTSYDVLGQMARSFNRMTKNVREASEQLTREAITDPLTGTFNQRHFRSLLKHEFERARRSGQPPTLLMIDIDFFKQYNDAIGHEGGNEVLKGVCRAIQENLREIDMLARYGGDEFSVILPQTDGAEAKIIAARIVSAVGACEFPGQAQLPQKRVTLSIGGASFPKDAQSMSDLVVRADQALYASKQAGRDRVSWSGA